MGKEEAEGKDKSGKTKDGRQNGSGPTGRRKHSARTARGRSRNGRRSTRTSILKPTREDDALAVDLGKADQRIVSITQKHIRGRLAETLLDLLDVYGYGNDGETLDLHITREDMANLSNMTTSNAIRTLSTFASEGLVEVHGRYIKLLDVAALQQISDNG